MKKSTSPDAIRQLAEQIAADLFTDDFDGKKGDSLRLYSDLVLMTDWSQDEVADRIETHLRNAAVTPKEKGK